MSGIHDMAISLPKCYISLEEFADRKQLAYPKLRHGLGLVNMSVIDADEDVVTLASNAIIELLSKNPEVTPSNLKRIYIGTESQIDGSKPMASYLLNICNQYYQSKGLGILDECDVSDTVFACIGAVDAMENCLLWLAQNPDDYAIVVAADIAKYTFNSSGEYTQGAGAIALLLSTTPALLDVNLKSGVSSQCSHDFFKPLRYSSQTNGQHRTGTSMDGEDISYKYQTLHSECAVFDGPLSNVSYNERIQQAFKSFKRKNSQFSIESWSKLIFHLPFAYQGRKAAVPFFLEFLEEQNTLASFKQALDIKTNGEEPQDNKRIRSSPEYKTYIDNKIAQGEYGSSQVGNLYTGSILLSLMSMLYYAAIQGEQLSGEHVALIAYGSGAKSKIFDTTIQQTWLEKAKMFHLDTLFTERTKLDYDTYKSLYYHHQNKPCSSKPSHVYLDHMGIGDLNYGARTYKFIPNQ